MAQPPPRKGAYNKFVQNLHKDQFSKLQAKNQQELDLLDDIRNFMKQRAAIEKLYADGLIKLSSHYGTKKIANLEDVRVEGEAASPGEHNVYVIWKRMLEENEKIAKARLAAIQVFQENISSDAKSVTTKKKINSKKALDRLSAIQAEVQISVSEVDRVKRIYFSEESDAIDMSKKAEDAELKAKGKKRDVMSIFQSRTTLKSKALKLSAKQDESDIKSTGARNDYLLAVETANAHQDRYFHYDLQMTMRDMEYGIYEKVSEYFGTIARTELLTCTALQNSYNKLKDSAETMTRDYNYKCYTKAYGCLADHVQYAFESVEGDTINHITPSEHDDGYSLKYEARTTAAKLNQAVKTIRAFRKRIKACEHHKAAGLQKEPNDANGPNLDDKIDELHAAIRAAETDLAKAKVRLKKLREGGVEVDSYLGDINLDTVQFDIEAEDKPKVATTWDSSRTESQAETPAVSEDQNNYAAQAEAGGDWATDGGWGEDAAPEQAEEAQEDWAEAGGWDNNQQEGQWNGENAALDGWGQQQSVESVQEVAEAEAQPQAEIDPNADIWKAQVLFTFTSQNEDELTVTENEDVEVLVRECDEEGWVMARNGSGQKGYVPSNYIEVYASVPKEETAQQYQPSYAATDYSSYSRQGSLSSSGQVVKQVSVESNASWGLPAAPAGMPPIPETYGGQTETEASETEAETEDDDMPPGMAPPMGPPPTISVVDSDNEGLGAGIRRNSRPVSINFGASLESEYCRGLYDYDANGPDELSFKEDDVIHIMSRNPNGVEDGWWLGDCDGRRGLFPSIVVEESQADGSDWSPDVSVCGSPPAFAPPPPCFEPPAPAAAPPPMPPAPAPSSAPPARPTSGPKVTSPPASKAPPARPPVPQIVMASSSASNSSSSDSESDKSESKEEYTQVASNSLSTTQIMITNPTPLVENEEDEREETQKSYYVEDSTFSMSMSDEKKDKYQNSVPVEVNVVVEPMKPIKIKLDSEAKPTPPPAPALAPTEIVVTAPTPRSGSPTDQEDDKEPLFSCTSESESEGADAVSPAAQGEVKADWASFGEKTSDDGNKGSEASADWANFGGQEQAEDKPVDSEASTGNGWASFSDKPSQPIPQVSVTEPESDPEPEPEPEPEIVKSKSEEKPAPVAPQPVAPPPVKPAPTVVRPSMADKVIRQVRIVETETSDFASDSDSEFINTKLQVAEPDGGITSTDAGPDSSDTESEDGRGAETEDGGRTDLETEDDRSRRTGRDSSDTESASEGPEDTSRETPSPRPGGSGAQAQKAPVPLPPEQLDPRQMKKLETMKESPA